MTTASPLPRTAQTKTPLGSVFIVTAASALPRTAQTQTPLGVGQVRPHVLRAQDLGGDSIEKIWLEFRLEKRSERERDSIPF